MKTIHNILTITLLLFTTAVSAQTTWRSTGNGGYDGYNYDTGYTTQIRRDFMSNTYRSYNYGTGEVQVFSPPDNNGDFEVETYPQDNDYYEY